MAVKKNLPFYKKNHVFRTVKVEINICSSLNSNFSVRALRTFSENIEVMLHSVAGSERDFLALLCDLYACAHRKTLPDHICECIIYDDRFFG